MLSIKHISFAALSLLFLFVSCKNAPPGYEEKAKELIAQAFKAGEDYTYNYIPGSFGELDSAYTTYLDDALYIAYSNKQLFSMDRGNLAFNEVARIGSEIDTTRNEHKKEKLRKEMLAASAEKKMFNDSSSFFLAKCDSIKKIYKPYYKGWKITHEYKANNIRGVQVEQKTVFYFDDALTKIIGPEAAANLDGNNSF